MVKDLGWTSNEVANGLVPESFGPRKNNGFVIFCSCGDAHAWGAILPFASLDAPAEASMGWLLKQGFNCNFLQQVAGNDRHPLRAPRACGVRSRDASRSIHNNRTISREVIFTQSTSGLP